MSLFCVRYVGQQLLKTGAEDVNSLHLHVAKNSAWCQHHRMLIVRLKWRYFLDLPWRIERLFANLRNIST
jgi:hypothetical protein